MAIGVVTIPPSPASSNVSREYCCFSKSLSIAIFKIAPKTYRKGMSCSTTANDSND